MKQYRMTLMGLCFFAVLQPLAALEISGFNKVGRVPAITWTADTNGLYALERQSCILSDNWTCISGLMPEQTHPLLNDVTTLMQDGMYYRVVSNRVASPGESLVTYINTTNDHAVAVEIRTPESPRYTNGAGVVVSVNCFFTEEKTFKRSPDFSDIGLVHISHLWPGRSAPMGVSSEGTYDHGGTNDIRALCDTIRFALGHIPNRAGKYLHELIGIQPLYDNVGLYAFSHPGIAAINALALHTQDLADVVYLVGRENPTIDKESCVEIGWYRDDGTPVFNPLYSYTNSYTNLDIIMDYGLARWSWADNRPYFDINENDVLDTNDHLLSTKVPTMYGRNMYSRDMCHALLTNGALAISNWPSDVGTPQWADNLWPFRSSIHRFPALRSMTGSLHVLLLFEKEDHVHPAPDKPHIHHAYEGFRVGAGGIWTRLNPDKAYMRWANPDLGAVATEHPANTQPDNWMMVSNWAYGYVDYSAYYPACAAVAEMADRCCFTNWSDELDGVLLSAPSPALERTMDVTTNGGELVTYVYSENIGNIAVQITAPAQPRYGDTAAGVVVIVSSFLGSERPFTETPPFEDAGLLRVTALWPGAEQNAQIASDGVYDYGGTNSIQALRDVIRFAGGKIPDREGRYLHEYLELEPLYDHLGLYAASHAGIAAVNALALHAAELADVAFYVGWENPTVDQIVACDIGKQPATNALYGYPGGYTMTNIILDYSCIRWDGAGIGYPYFDLNTNDTTEPYADYLLPTAGSGMFGKRFYSTEVLHALEINGELSMGTWPTNLARPTEADGIWAYRESPLRFTPLAAGNPDLKVMLLFGKNDHMQPAVDKPHVHQAWDGFRTNGLWVRLNADSTYAQWAWPDDPAVPDNDATNAPVDWLDINDWAYTNGAWYSVYAALAAAAELCDRIHTTNWLPNLTNTLVAYPTPP
jgi:hypothetical protein